MRTIKQWTVIGVELGKVLNDLNYNIQYSKSQIENITIHKIIEILRREGLI